MNSHLVNTLQRVQSLYNVLVEFCPFFVELTHELAYLLKYT